VTIATITLRFPILDTRLRAFICLLLAGLLAAACGGGSSVPDQSLEERLTMQAGGAGTPNGSSVTPVVGTPSPPVAATGTAAATQPSAPDAGTVLQIRTLGTLVLTEDDLPESFAVLSRQGAFRDEVIAAQRGVPPLADFLASSTLRGSWAALFTSDGTPPVVLSSIILLFHDELDATRLVAVNAGLQVPDYPGATGVQRLPDPGIGHASALVRFTTVEGGSLELTWTQGPMGGQLILRFSGDVEPADATDTLIGLAVVQSGRMATFLP
jgi:hypothetical protein